MIDCIYHRSTRAYLYLRFQSRLVVSSILGLCFAFLLVSVINIIVRFQVLYFSFFWCTIPVPVLPSLFSTMPLLWASGYGKGGKDYLIHSLVTLHLFPLLSFLVVESEYFPSLHCWCWARDL